MFNYSKISSVVIKQTGQRSFDEYYNKRSSLSLSLAARVPH